MTCVLEKVNTPNFCFEAFREHSLHGQSAPTSKEVLSLFLLLLKWPMMLIFGWICLCSWMVAQLGQQSTVQQSSIMEPCNIVMMMTMIAKMMTMMMMTKMNTVQQSSINEP